METNLSISVKNLRKSFGSQTVLDSITFELNAGKVTCVLGRSGTGKSVLLKLLIGLESPDSGSICLFGHEINDATPEMLNEARKKVGFMFQNAALYDSMNLEDNVAFPLRRHLNLSDSECRSRARELLSGLGMERDFTKMPSEISGGMKKRVGLARALALDPIAVMFDEPTAGLDPMGAAEIATLIVDLREKRKITSLVVTHDLHTAHSVADRLIVLDGGKMIFDGTFDELEKSKVPFIVQYLKDAA